MAVNTQLDDDFKNGLAEATSSILGNPNDSGFGIPLDATSAMRSGQQGFNNFTATNTDALKPSDNGAAGALADVRRGGATPFPGSENRGFGLPTTAGLGEDFLFKGASPDVAAINGLAPVGPPGQPQAPGNLNAMNQALGITQGLPTNPLAGGVPVAAGQNVQFPGDIQQNGLAPSVVNTPKSALAHSKDIFNEVTGFDDFKEGIVDPTVANAQDLYADVGIGGIVKKGAKRIGGGLARVGEEVAVASTEIAKGREAGQNVRQSFADNVRPYYEEPKRRAQALQYAATQGFEGTEDEQIEQSVAHRQDAVAQQTNLVDSLAEKFVGNGVSLEQARAIVQKGLRTGKRATPAMDEFIRKRNNAKQDVFDAAKQGGSAGIRASNEFNSGGLTSPTGSPDGGSALSQMAGVDPGTLKTSGDTLAYNAANSLTNALQSAQAFGKIPASLQKRVDRATTKLQGLRGQSAGGKIKGLQQELTQIGKALETHAASNKQGLATRGEFQKQAIAKSNAVFDQKYKTASLRALIERSTTKSSVPGSLTEAQTLSEMKDIRETGEISFSGKDDVYKKFDNAMKLVENGSLKDWRKFQFTRQELEFLDLQVNLKKFRQ
jgi:hypothetical protein